MYWSTDFETFFTISAYASICLIEVVTIELNTPSIKPPTKAGKFTRCTTSANASPPSSVTPVRFCGDAGAGAGADPDAGADPGAGAPGTGRARPIGPANASALPASVIEVG